jgi:hypothetical protein
MFAEGLEPEECEWYIALGPSDGIPCMLLWVGCILEGSEVDVAGWHMFKCEGPPEYIPGDGSGGGGEFTEFELELYPHDELGGPGEDGRG